MSPSDGVDWILSAPAIRERCGEVLAAGLRDELRHFAIDESALERATDVVVEEIRGNYPDLEIPYHSRWRHFEQDDRDYWQELEQRIGEISSDERARIRFDLAVVSVLLDAGAGDEWKFREATTGEIYRRSEGLALASFFAFSGGLFSAREQSPLRADAEALKNLVGKELGACLQVSDDNPIKGLDGRVEVLRTLGKAAEAQPEVFGKEAPRIGNLFDYLCSRAGGNRLRAATILEVLLHALGPIWPGRLEIDGTNLGDVWPHDAARKGDGQDPTDGLVPFHKLSQWLAYSLVEPLEQAGIEVVDLDDLTGLPEYRNGGLLIDTGVLVAKDEALGKEPLKVDSDPIIEWRALTVPLLDRLAEQVRTRLELSAEALPLAKILQGGTWSAGRRLARERREGGGSPLPLDSDGTVI